MLEKLESFLTSSTGQGISLRIKSASAIIVFGLGLLKFTIDPGAISDLADQVGIAVTALGALVGVVLHLKAWARRNFHKENGLGAFKK